MRGKVLLFSFILAPSVYADVYEEGGAIDFHDTSLKDGFNIEMLGQMMFNFYRALRDNESIFLYLMKIGDMLLVPILMPLIVICTGSRLMQELHHAEGKQDLLSVFYSVGAVVLILVLYRYLMSQLVMVTNTLAAATVPQGYSFESVMGRIEDTLVDFDKKEKSNNVIAQLINKTLSLYTQYVLAWTSKWGVMILHGLLSYLRKFLFAINYVLGIFILPFIIIRNNSLPRNWFLLTAVILIWTVVEAVMIAAIGELGVTALNAAMAVEGKLSALAESLFFIMITTVNVLIGIALLSSIWIVKTYFMSPSSISTIVAAFSMPAVAMAGMMGKAAAKTGHSAASYAVAGIASRSLPRLPMKFPPPRKDGPVPSSGESAKTPPKTAKGIKSPITSSPRSAAKPPMVRTQKGPKRRALVEYRGALPAKALPENVVSVSRVGRRKKL